MLIPISWLKDFVDIKLPLKDLMWKMTEAGLTCESYKKVGDDIVLDVEVTANRPDWMCIVGVAREVAAIQGLKVREPVIKDLPRKTQSLPITLKNNFEIMTRWSAVIISGIKIGNSPDWIQKRLKLVGLRPINNIVDITNYVMFELGIPMHAFDYDEIRGHEMIVEKTKGGEDFTSVDELSYKLPKDAMIIKDTERIIDLCGIKGGFNSGIKDSTKNLFIHCTIDNPVLTRRSSIALGLRSDASAIYERGPDKGGTINTLKRMANLIHELAGGEIASDVIDLKNPVEKYFEPWKLSLTFDNLEKILGIRIDDKLVINILTKLNLSPKKLKNVIECTIPTYRGDLKIEEDLVEEVARIYGYNKFPYTLPVAKINPQKIPYFFDDSFNLKLKELMVSSGYFETNTLSLTSKVLIDKFGLNPKDHIKLTNPVSKEYEYMRASLIPSLVLGLTLNHQKRVMIFEIDKVYPSESYKLTAVAKGVGFRKFKGILGLIFGRLNISGVNIDFETNTPYWHPSKGGKITVDKKLLGEFGYLSPEVIEKMSLKDPVLAFEIDIGTLQKLSKQNIFISVPENPSQEEDLTIYLLPKTRLGEVIKTIADSSSYIYKVDYVDSFEGSYTFHIIFQHPEKTMTNDDVEKIRKDIISSVKNKFGGTVKG